MKFLKILTIFVIGILYSSCSEDNMPLAYVVNQTDHSIVIYSKSDSLILLPNDTKFLASILVEEGNINSFTDCQLGADLEIYQIKINDCLYHVVEPYNSFLMRLDKYLPHKQTVITYPPYNKDMVWIYEFYLTEEFIDKIIRATN